MVLIHDIWFEGVIIISVEITDHARKRMKERCGFKKGTQDKMAEKAFVMGIQHSQTKGRLNKWITSLYFNNKRANNIRIYGDYAYIFCNNSLITVFAIPIDLRKDKDKMIKK